MPDIKKVKIIFEFFFKKLLRSGRTKFFLIASFVPLGIFLLIRMIELMNNYSSLSGPIFFSRAGMSFFFQLFIQLISLFFGTTIIADEKDNKTLIYLITSPASRSSILAGKLMSHLLVAYSVFFIGISSLLIATHSKYLLTSIFAERFILLNLTGFLSITAYTTLFLLFGTFLKKSTIIGLIYIFGWEYIAMFIPGSAQKLTLIHYIRSITPMKIRVGNSPFTSFSEPATAPEAIIVLVLVSIIFLVLSSYIFRKKEYIMTGNI